MKKWAENCKNRKCWQASHHKCWLILKFHDYKLCLLSTVWKFMIIHGYESLFFLFIYDQGILDSHLASSLYVWWQYSVTKYVFIRSALCITGYNNDSVEFNTYLCTNFVVTLARIWKNLRKYPRMFICPLPIYTVVRVYYVLWFIRVGT